MKEKNCLKANRFRSCFQGRTGLSYVSAHRCSCKTAGCKRRPGLAGQKIGEAGGFISANVICSVSGTVKAIEPRRTANGAMVPSVIVENDGAYETVEGLGEDRNPGALSKEGSVPLSRKQASWDWAAQASRLM